MKSKLKDKIKDIHIGKDVKETASALVSDVKEIAKDTKGAAGDALAHVRKSTKETLRTVEKKMG